MPSAGVYLAQSISSLKLRLPDWNKWRMPSFRRRHQSPSPVVLARMIESEVIPRLLVAHGPQAVAVPTPEGVSAITQEDVLAFAPMTIEQDAASLLDFLDGVIARGVPLEAVLLDLVVPAARELGVGWEEDRTDFIDVTMGLWRMQEVTYELTSRLPSARGMARFRALLSPMPGDQHGFGSLMAEEFFRLAGWQTRSIVEPLREALIAEAATGDYDLYALNVTKDEDVAEFGALVGEMRAASPNKRLIVLVGGRAIPAEPGFVEARGADGTADDARGAVTVAARLVEARVEALAAS